MSDSPSDLTSTPTFSSLKSASNSSDSSSQEKGEIIKKLKNKVTNLLLVQKRNEKLEQNQGEIKKCCDKIETYRQANQELQKTNKLFFDTLGIPRNSNPDDIKKIAQGIKEKLNTYNTINDYFSLDSKDENPTEVFKQIQQLKDKEIENDRSFSKMLRTFGIFDQAENPSDLLSQKILLLKDQAEESKALIESMTSQQDEICDLLNITESDPYTRHFRLKEAIKSIQSCLHDEINEFASILGKDKNQKFETPQMVKSAISDLQNSTTKAQRELVENEEKLAKTTAQLNDIKEKHKKITKKLNCETFEEIGENLNDLMSLMGSATPDLLRSSVRQMKDQNKQLNNQSAELSSKCQLLQINNQTLNEQLTRTQDQLCALKSKLNESQAKRQAFKDELKEFKTKMNSIKTEMKALSIEKNTLKGQLNDKEEQVNSLKSLLQSEKGNIKAHFEEMDDQILALKSQLRKSQIENESYRQDIANLEEANKNLNAQKAEIKNEKQKIEEELESLNNQIRQLTRELKSKSDDLDAANTAVNETKQKNQELGKKLDDLDNERTKLKSEITNLNSQISSYEQANSSLSSQLESVTNENKAFQQQIEENKQTILQLKNDVSTKVNQIEKLTNEKQNLINKNNENKKIISQLENKAAELESNLKEMVEKTEKLRDEINAFKAEKLNLQNQLGVSKREIETLRNQLENSKHEIEALDSQLENSKQEIETQKNANAELKQSNIALRKEFQQNKLESETKISKLEDNIENIKIEVQRLELVNESSKKQIEDFKEKNVILSKDNNSLKSQLAQLELKCQNIASILNLSHFDNVENKISQIVHDEEQYRQMAENCQQLIEELENEKDEICRILGINFDNNKNFNSITNTISDLLSDNKEMYYSIQNTKQQMTKIASLLDVPNPFNFDQIQGAIHNLHDEVDQREIDRKDDIRELANLKQFNQRIYQIFNVMNPDSLIDEINSIQMIISQLKQILRVNEDQIIEYIEKLNSDIDLICKELNLDPNDWVDSILLMFESLQNVAGILKITNTDQLSSAVKQIVSENEKMVDNINSIYSNLKNCKYNTLDAVKSHELLLPEISALVKRESELEKIVSDLKSNEEKICSLFGIKLSLNPYSDIKNEVSKLNKDISDLQQNIQKMKQKMTVLTQTNEELQQQNSELFQQNSDLIQRSEILKQENQSIHFQNEEHSQQIDKLKKHVSILADENQNLSKQNKSFEDELNNDELMQKQLFDICKLLQIRPSSMSSNSCSRGNINSKDIIENNKIIYKSVTNAISSMQKANAEFIRFKEQVVRLLKSNESTNQDVFSKIEKMDSIIADLCRLLNSKDSDSLVESVKKNVIGIRQFSTLFDIFGIKEIDEKSKFSSMISEIKKTKKTYDKISELINSAKEPASMINSLKSLQSRLHTLQMKEDLNDKIFGQICQSLKSPILINSNDNKNDYRQILSEIKNLMNKLTESENTFDKLSKLFNCDKDYILDYANLMSQTLNILSKLFGINIKAPSIFSSIEKAASSMKSQNDSLVKKYEEDQNFINTFLNELEFDERATDKNTVRVVLTKLKNMNSVLKEQNGNLKKIQNENDELITELEEKLSVLNCQNRDLNRQLKIPEESAFAEVLNQINDLRKIKKQYQLLTGKNKDLSHQIRTIESEIIRFANSIKQSRHQITNSSDALNVLKAHDIQIEKIRQITNIPNSQFSVVVDKISQINDNLSIETEANSKLTKDITLTKTRVKDLEAIEEQCKRLIKVQEEKIESMTNTIEQKEMAISVLDNSLNSVFVELGGGINSTDFAIDAIVELKRKIDELEKESAALKNGATADKAFKNMSKSEKHQLKQIRQKILEQNDFFNSILSKLSKQIESKNQNLDEMKKILKEAEKDSYRLLELLDPSLCLGPNMKGSDNYKQNANMNSIHTKMSNHEPRIHIGNEYSMNPFAKQDVDMFRQRMKCDPTPVGNINHKIHMKEMRLNNQNKKAKKAERKEAALGETTKKRVANPLKSQQTTLF